LTSNSAIAETARVNHLLSTNLAYRHTVMQRCTKTKMRHIDELKQRLIDKFGTVVYSSRHQRGSHWPVANTAVCMCKGKGTSLRTPTM